jgi:hypothetical protein
MWVVGHGARAENREEPTSGFEFKEKSKIKKYKWYFLTICPVNLGDGI